MRAEKTFGSPQPGVQQRQQQQGMYRPSPSLDMGAYSGGAAQAGAYRTPPSARPAPGGTSQQWGTPGSGGGVYTEPSRSFGGTNFPPSGFTARYGDPFGGTSSMPQTGQRDAFIQRLNDVTLPLPGSPGYGQRPSMDMGAMWRQAGDMVQGGFTNPFAPGQAQPIQPPSQGTPYGQPQRSPLPQALTMERPPPASRPGQVMQGGLQAGAHPAPRTVPSGPGKPVALAPPVAPPPSRRALTPYDGNPEFQEYLDRYPGISPSRAAAAYERDQASRQEQARWEFDARYGNEAERRTAQQMIAQERYAREQRAREQGAVEAEYRGKFIAQDPGIVYTTADQRAEAQAYQRQQAIFRGQENARSIAAMYSR